MSRLHLQQRRRVGNFQRERERRVVKEKVRLALYFCIITNSILVLLLLDNNNLIFHQVISEWVLVKIAIK